ncbi:vanadium-dependent haloperoxidase [Salegentibacter sp. F14]
MKSKAKLFFIYLLTGFVISCSNPAEPIEVSAEQYHHVGDHITDIMVHDIFSPPVASRIYAYTNIAAYEVLALTDPKLKSFAGRYQDLETVPQPKKNEHLNPRIAALVAKMEMGKALLFSEEKITSLRDSLYQIWEGKNPAEFKVSRAYGMEVVSHLKDWANKDNYKETRTMPKFSVYSEDPSRWQPTPPAYMDGIEPHWNKIRSFSLDSASQFRPEDHPEYSLEENSEFYQELLEVYQIKKQMEQEGEDSQKIQIARFWDCNPYVSTQRGHLMFATKKITPGGHWMGICKIASQKNGLDFEQTSYAYTTTAIAIADGFISCWDEKYRSELIRPETLINREIDESWMPVLQTPPFPEYPSGHSVVSGAAATVLTKVFGDNFAFEDDTEVKYGLPVRSFPSFEAAAEEAAISRLYGGIHYRSAIDKGLVQGRSLGNYVVDHFDIQSLRR